MGFYGHFMAAISGQTMLAWTMATSMDNCAQSPVDKRIGKILVQNGSAGINPRTEKWLQSIMDGLSRKQKFRQKKAEI